MNKLVLLIMVVNLINRHQLVKSVKTEMHSKTDPDELHNSVLRLREELSLLQANHKLDLEKLEKKLEMKIDNYKIDWSSGKENRLEDVEDNLTELEDVIATLKSNYQTFKNNVNTEIKQLKEKKSQTTRETKQSGSWQDEKLFGYINELQEESLATRLKLASHKNYLEKLEDSQDTLRKSVSKIHSDYLALVLKILVLQSSSNGHSGNRSIQTNHGLIATHTSSRTITKGIISFNKIFYNSGYFDLTDFKFYCPRNGLYQVSVTTCTSDGSDSDAKVSAVIDMLDKEDLTEILDSGDVYINSKSTTSRNVVCYLGESIWLLNTKAGTLWSDKLHQCPTFSVMFLEDI